MMYDINKHEGRHKIILFLHRSAQSNLCRCSDQDTIRKIYGDGNRQYLDFSLLNGVVTGHPCVR